MNDIDLLLSTTLGLPTGVEEMEEVQQSSKKLKLSAKDLSIVEAVIDTQLVQTSCQFSTIRVKKEEEPQGLSKKEEPMDFSSEDLSVVEAVIDYHLVQTHVVVEKKEPQPECKEEIPVTLGTEDPAFVEAEIGSYEILTCIVDKEEEPQPACREEISVNLGLETPSHSVAMATTQVDNNTTQEAPLTEVNNNTTQEAPLTEVKEEFEAQQTLNPEASSLVDTLIDSQHVETTSLIQHDQIKAELQDTDKELVSVAALLEVKAEEQSFKEKSTEAPSYFVAMSNTQFDNNGPMGVPLAEVKEEEFEPQISLTLNPEDSSLVDTLIDSQHVETTSLIPHDQIKAEPLDAGAELVGVTALVKTRAKEEDMETTQKNILNDSAKDLPFECSDCKKRFKNERILYIHQRVHTIDFKRPYKCNICGETFRSSTGLLKHSRKAHTNDEPFKCRVCDKLFTCINSRRSHMRSTHTGVVPSERPKGGKYLFECSVCKKKFFCMDACQAHMRTHAKEKYLYKCDWCNKTFLNKLTCKVHMDTHAGRAKKYVYECDVCCATFSNMDSCQAHIRAHTGLESKYVYECDVCNEPFINTDSCQEHMLTHNSDKPYACNKRYLQRSSLNTHMAVSHVQVKEEEKV